MSDIERNEFVNAIKFLSEAEQAVPLPIEKAKINQESLSKRLTPDELIINDGDKSFRSFGFKQQTASDNDYGNNFSIGKVIDKFGQYAASIYEPKIEGHFEVYVYWGKHVDADEKSPG